MNQGDFTYHKTETVSEGGPGIRFFNHEDVQKKEAKGEVVSNADQPLHRHPKGAAKQEIKSVCRLSVEFIPLAAFRVVPRSSFNVHPNHLRTATQDSFGSLPQLHTNSTIEVYDAKKFLEMDRDSNGKQVWKTNKNPAIEQFVLWMNLTPRENLDDLRLVRDPLVVVNTGETVEDKKKTLGTGGRSNGFTRYPPDLRDNALRSRGII